MTRCFLLFRQACLLLDSTWSFWQAHWLIVVLQIELFILQSWSSLQIRKTGDSGGREKKKKNISHGFSTTIASNTRAQCIFTRVSADVLCNFRAGTVSNFRAVLAFAEVVHAAHFNVQCIREDRAILKNSAWNRWICDKKISRVSGFVFSSKTTIF